MIKIKNVTKIYGKGDSELKALDNVSVEIPDGKFAAIVGKSGSGKTTLLNLIGALDNEFSGEILCNGSSLSKLNENELAAYRNKNIGYVFQAFYLEPNFTVLENVEMPLVIAGMDKELRRKKAKEMIIKLGIEDKTDKKVSTLSGGQKQRVSIARALVHNPNIILADEPTGNLDSKNGNEVISILKEISNQGTTVILVTHNAEYAQKTDFIIEIVDGQIAEITDKGN